MLVPSLEKFEKHTLSNRANVVIGERHFFEKIPAVVSGLIRRYKKSVVVFPELKYYRKYSESFEASLFEHYPPLDVLPFDPMPASLSTARQRMKTLLRGMEAGKTIVTTALGLLQNTISFEELEKKKLIVHEGDERSQKSLINFLTNSGYQRVFNVKESGQFSVRGFIVDFFPLNTEMPCRIEFFDDEITEIRTFDINSQRKVDRLNSVVIAPAREFIFDDENREVFNKRMNKLSQKYSNSPFISEISGNPMDYQALSPLFLNKHKPLLSQIEDDTAIIYIDVAKGFESIRQFERELFELYPGTEYKELYYRYLRVSESLLLRPEKWINISPDESALATSDGKRMHEVIRLDDKDIKLKKPEKTVSKFLEYQTEALIDEEGIERGTIVVHEDYGIGRYLGNEVITNYAGTREYLKLEYDNAVKIFVPVDNIDRVHRYVGDPELVKLSKLKGKSWAKSKKKVREDIEKKVEELIKLYAVRENATGISFKGDRELEENFFNSFPHIETPAQDQAIKEVLEDMEKEKPMDRLVFGDAGSGKTEVAMRAAFRAVSSGYQVAMLVPTTVLSKQHYETFIERMEGFGLNVKLLNRFITQAQRKKIVTGIKEGRVDIVIGTHSLLSKTVKFDRLGLLIIDEEQKFGVTQKERIKSFKEQIDVLTLSATPIPRTLYMGLSGIKEMSVIDTMPPGRIPIEVTCSQYNEKLIKTAILREVTRGGQVLYVHNRVEDIDEVLERVRGVVPEIKTGLAHGRMAKKRFEKTVNDFYTGELEMLLCTTIIESGVDIPNANTLIIDDAQRYGLSQLYQLRGRVGRSDRRAFAYFLYPKRAKLKPESKSRLEAISKFHGAGSGLQLSMRDMEIRGIGNILGMEQHGEINTIGLHLYRQILDDVLVSRGLKKGEKKQQKKKPESRGVELKGFYFEVLIPEDYIDNNIERMKVYRKIALCEDMEDFRDVEAEIKDRFGKPPKQFRTLLFYAKLRLMATRLGISRVEKLGSSRQFKLFFRDLKSTDKFEVDGMRGFVNREERAAVLFNDNDKKLAGLLEKNLS